MKTLLVYLEIINIISPRYTYFESYTFQYLIVKEKILAHFKGERKSFVTTIFEYCFTAKKWTSVDIDAIVAKTGSNRQRVLAALEYFHGQGWIYLQPKSGVEVYDIIDSSFDIDATAHKLASLFAEKEKKDVSRLHTMIELFESDQCLAKNLSAYFGETLEAECGKCSVCTGQNQDMVQLPSYELPSLEEFNFDSLVQPLVEAPLPSMPVNMITRFLCGVTSPLLIQYKARQLPGFGRLKAHPYKLVEKWVKHHHEKIKR
ncbi:MAG: RecQ family zinc-binding domain-containing protein [Desulfobacteraceae bacterium]|nr:RecQ family zinc-binding domain-containing protein [Desulfobacteraceae bacterium]